MPTTPTSYKDISLVDMVKKAFHKKNRIAMVAGSAMGGIVPIFTYLIKHHEVTSNPYMWIFVTGGLIYSFNAVFDFAKIAFSSEIKAGGFVLLVEGAMTFSSTPAVFRTALVFLIVINALASGMNIALASKSK